jgi:hypothetical protein
MPAPTAESDECVSPKRRRSQSPAKKTVADATAPQSTRTPGPIQPWLAARMKKKMTPRSVTMPPAQASTCGPGRSERSQSRGGRGGAVPYAPARSGCAGREGKGLRGPTAGAGGTGAPGTGAAGTGAAGAGRAGNGSRAVAGGGVMCSGCSGTGMASPSRSSAARISATSSCRACIRYSTRPRRTSRSSVSTSTSVG